MKYFIAAFSSILIFLGCNDAKKPSIENQEAKQETAIKKYRQNANKNLIGKWYSIDGKNIALAFTSTIERKYHIKKGVSRVPNYNIEEAQISITGDVLNEKQAGGGGINVNHKFNISNDTLTIYYRNNTIKYSFK